MGCLSSVLPVAGAVVGNIVAPGVGGAIGGALGSAAGNALGGSGANAAGGPSGGAVASALGTSPQVYSKNPGWVNTAQQTNYNNAAAAASQPYQAYTGEQVAGRTNNQMLASQNAAAQIGRFSPTYSTITDYLNQSAAPITSTYTPDTVTAQNVSTGNFSNADLSGYMNPYVQASLAPQLQAINQQFATQQNQIGANAAGAGSFGGSRQALLNSQTALNNQNTVAGIEANGYNTAFNDAQNAYETDQARQLQAQQSNQSANLNAGEFNQTQNADAYNTNYNTAVGNRNALTTAASGLNGLVNTQEGVTNSINNQLLQTGGVAQQTNQAQDTANYQNYLNQLYYPEQQASYLNGLLNTGGSGSLSAQSGVLGNSGTQNLVNGLGSLGSSLTSGISGLFGDGSTASGTSGADAAAASGITNAAAGNGGFLTNLGSFGIGG